MLGKNLPTKKMASNGLHAKNQALPWEPFWSLAKFRLQAKKTNKYTERRN